MSAHVSSPPLASNFLAQPSPQFGSKRTFNFTTPNECQGKDYRLWPELVQTRARAIPQAGLAYQKSLESHHIPYLALPYDDVATFSRGTEFLTGPDLINYHLDNRDLPPVSLFERFVTQPFRNFLIAHNWTNLRLCPITPPLDETNRGMYYSYPVGNHVDSYAYPATYGSRPKGPHYLFETHDWFEMSAFTTQNATQVRKIYDQMDTDQEEQLFHRALETHNLSEKELYRPQPNP